MAHRHLQCIATGGLAFLWINGALYAYHDWKDSRIMKRLYEIENAFGSPIEVERLRLAEYKMIEYHALCHKYLLFKVLIGPPEVNFHLLPQKVSFRQ